MAKEKDLEQLILKLMAKAQQVSVKSIAREAGLSDNDASVRKKISRAITSLQKQLLLTPQGAGRSRVYIPVSREKSEERGSTSFFNRGYFLTSAGPFANIELSDKSHELLKYVSAPEAAREPVGYNQDFLRSYKPNETFYLKQKEREVLHRIGLVESQVRPAGTYAKNILNRLLIDLSWNSSRLEGNTYSLLETKRLIEFGETAPGKDATEALMILNHKTAIEFVVENTESGSITSLDVRSIHGLLSENLLGDSSASGRIRELAVGISGTTYLPLENPHILKELFELAIEKLNAIEDEFEQSVFALVHLSYLQAFEDVNKRTARLVANIPLIKKNLKPLSFIDVNSEAYVKALLGVYEKNDVSLLVDLYLWAYGRSSQRYSALQQSLAQPNPLLIRYREIIKAIVRNIILEQTKGSKIVQAIRSAIESTSDVKEADRTALFELIENEILSLHEGNAAKFKVRPSEFQAWKQNQQ